MFGLVIQNQKAVKICMFYKHSIDSMQNPSVTSTKNSNNSNKNKNIRFWYYLYMNRRYTTGKRKTINLNGMKSLISVSRFIKPATFNTIQLSLFWTYFHHISYIDFFDYSRESLFFNFDSIVLITFLFDFLWELPYW